jgi:hypothetical protein
MGVFTQQIAAGSKTNRRRSIVAAKQFLSDDAGREAGCGLFSIGYCVDRGK